MINKTTDGFTYSGVENLTEKPTLFIGNHRDISLDRKKFHATETIMG